MVRAVRIAGQIIAYAAFAAFVGYFSATPAYVHVDPGKAVIKLSFAHASARKAECRRLTPEELAKLAPNMRRPLECTRERVPILVELLMDGKLLYRDTLRPTGLARDGPAVVYQRFVVKPGRHLLVARLRASRKTTGFDYEQSAEVDLAPQQNFVIDFRGEPDGFVFK